MLFQTFTLLLATFIGTLQAVYFCTNGNEMCVNSTITGNGTLMQFTITTGVNGWVGIGFGSRRMKGADIYMLYTLNNRQVVSDRTGTGHSLPTIDAVQSAQLVSGPPDASITLPADHKTIYRFSRPLVASAPDFTLSTNSVIDLIWAVSNSPVTSSTNLREHDGYGSLSVNLFDSGNSSAGEEIFVDPLVIWHGILMTIAWAGLVPLAVFIARYGKRRMGVWWFRWHYGLLLIAVLFTLVAAGLIMNAKGWILFENIHTTIGTVMVIAAVTQVVLGIFIDRMFRPSRRSTPLRDKLHWWLGRLLTLAAVVNIFLGIEVAELGVIYWYFAYAGLLVLTAALFWVGQQQSGGQQHHEHLSDEHIAMAKNKHSSEESFI